MEHDRVDVPARPAPLGMPSRVLVSRIRQIGDVILSLPVIDAIRERFPDAEIDYLAEEAPAQAAIGHPALRRVLAFNPQSWPGLPASPDLLFRLRAARYDWAIDLYGNPRSAMLTRATGAPVRVGPARKGRRHWYTHVVPPVAEPYPAVDHHLLALRELGLSPRRRMPRIHLSEDERNVGAALLASTTSPGGPRVGLHVGNRWAAKRWPPERFRALSRLLSRKGVRTVVLAGPGEDALARGVAQGAGSASGKDAPVIAGLPLRQYFAVVASLDALVTNDGSPLHAGPALGVPTVGILGPTLPAIWFPYLPTAGHQLLCREIWCRPCHRHECSRMDCLDWIGVGDALRATERALTFAEEARASA